MRLLKQPGEGVAPLVEGIAAAKRSVDILIFRFDLKEVEKALADAVSRGVAVQALIAHVNSSGRENLRRLELRLLAAGVSVSRTADSLTRYHAKMMVIDQKELYLMSFNFTQQDINRSRSFAIITKDKELVAEAVKLFEADTKRKNYKAGLNTFVVSPVNARKELTKFIEGAKQELLIYDPNIGDPEILKALEAQAKQGVEVKVIGKMGRLHPGVSARKLQMRLHTRTIIRDRKHAFVGSQSLRQLELDGRREVGIIFSNSGPVSELAQTFDEDWELSEPIKAPIATEGAPVAKLAKKLAKAVSKDMPPLAPVLEGTLKEMVGAEVELPVDVEDIEDAVRAAVKTAVKEAIKGVMAEAEQTAAVKA